MFLKNNYITKAYEKTLQANIFALACTLYIKIIILLLLLLIKVDSCEWQIIIKCNNNYLI